MALLPVDTSTFTPAEKAAYTGPLNDTQLATTGVATPTPTTSTTPDYYPRTAAPTLADSPLAAPTPESVDTIQAKKTAAAQDQINALSGYYADLSREQLATNQKNDRSTSSISTLTGLAGSTEANTAQQETSKQGQQALDKIKNEQAVAVQGILSKIREDSATEARQQRLDYNASITDSITNRANLAKMESDQLAAAGDHIKNLTAAGVTPDGLKNTDPASYDYLLKQYKGDAQALKGAFLLNTPQDQVLSKEIIGGAFVIARMNPITNKVSIDRVDLGLPPQFTESADLGDKIMFYEKGNPDNHTFVSKGLTPDQAATNAGGGATAGYNGDFAATVDLASNQGGTNAQRAQIKNALQTFIANGDYGSAYAAINGATSAGLKGTAATTFQQQQNSLGVLDSLHQAIKAYAAAGGSTNILKGTADNIQTNIGKLMTDPKYASLAVQLNAAFQNYRLQMTGAAFGDAESAQYAAILPAPGNTLDLNLAKLEGAKSYLNSSVESSIKSVVGQGGVYIKQYAEGATPATGGGAPPGEKVLVKDGQSFDATDLTPEEYQQAISDGYVAQ